MELLRTKIGMIEMDLIFERKVLFLTFIHDYFGGGYGRQFFWGDLKEIRGKILGGTFGDRLILN